MNTKKSVKQYVMNTEESAEHYYEHKGKRWTLCYEQTERRWTLCYVNKGKRWILCYEETERRWTLCSEHIGKRWTLHRHSRLSVAITSTAQFKIGLLKLLASANWTRHLWDGHDRTACLYSAGPEVQQQTCQSAALPTHQMSINLFIYYLLACKQNTGTYVSFSALLMLQSPHSVTYPLSIL
jgi:hypothetical protein